MGVFFVTTNVRNGERCYQFSFETTEANTVEEFVGALANGGMIVGERFNPRNPSLPRNKTALSQSMVGMVQEQRSEAA